VGHCGSLADLILVFKSLLFLPWTHMDEHGQILFMHARLGMNKATDACGMDDPRLCGSLWVIG